METRLKYMYVVNMHLTQRIWLWPFHLLHVSIQEFGLKNFKEVSMVPLFLLCIWPLFIIRPTYVYVFEMYQQLRRTMSSLSKPIDINILENRTVPSGFLSIANTQGKAVNSILCRG